MSDHAERISAALARGQKAAAELGPATDALTETIAQFERVLAEQRLGVVASVELAREQIDSGPDAFVGWWVEALAFRKEGKAWRLVIDAGPEDSDGAQWSTVLLINSSRELRMAAVEKLPDLVEALARAAERELADVEARRAKAQALLDALPKRQGAKEKTP